MKITKKSSRNFLQIQNFKKQNLIKFTGLLLITALKGELQGVSKPVKQPKYFRQTKEPPLNSATITITSFCFCIICILCNFASMAQMTVLLFFLSQKLQVNSNFLYERLKVNDSGILLKIVSSWIFFELYLKFCSNFLSQIIFSEEICEPLRGKETIKPPFHCQNCKTGLIKGKRP